MAKDDNELSPLRIEARRLWREENPEVRKAFEQGLADVKMEEQAAAKNDESEFKRKLARMGTAEFTNEMRKLGIF